MESIGKKFEGEQDHLILDLRRPVTKKIAWLKTAAVPLLFLLLSGPKFLLTMVSSKYALRLRTRLSEVLPQRIHERRSKLTRAFLYFLEFPIERIVREAAFLDEFTAAIDEHRPHTVIFAEETIYNSSLYMIQEARSRGIRSVVVPFAVGVRREYLTAARRSVGFDAVKRLLSARLFPEYALRVADGRLLSFPAHCVFSAAHFGIPASRVWAAHLDFADLYLYSDESDAENANRHTVDGQKIVVIESPQASEALALMESNERVPGVRDPRGGPQVLVLVPPNQFPIECSFSNYASLLDFYFGEIAKGLPDGATCLLSVHPREKLDDRQLTSFEKYQVVDSVSEGLSLADLVVSYGSALNSVVEYLAKPLVTLNIYGLENLDPISAKASTSVARLDNFSRLIHHQICHLANNWRPANFERRPSVIDVLAPV